MNKAWNATWRKRRGNAGQATKKAARSDRRRKLEKISRKRNRR
jgi:hypothetical protein